MASRPSGPAANAKQLNEQIVACRACPRLVEWRERVALEKRASFARETYWGKPVPGFGDPSAAVLIVGLAPAAHGGNRTGRIFTGDRSGDWLFGSLFRTGFADRPRSVAPGDGLTLTGAYIGAVVRCAPPANRPTIEERDRCLPYLIAEIQLLEHLRVVVALGSFAWDGVLRAMASLGMSRRPKPRFGHLEESRLGDHTILGSYHPSQQNTFTGRLTESMLDAVFRRARELTGG
ncbi:MAG: uracil-DNA glycosylase [Actinomycetota bacterium]|nr:uracil-DNA glycosylase [Actinomycetota bacterium]